MTTPTPETRRDENGRCLVCLRLPHEAHTMECRPLPHNPWCASVGDSAAQCDCTRPRAQATDNGLRFCVCGHIHSADAVCAACEGPTVEGSAFRALVYSFGDAVDAVGPMCLWADDADAFATCAAVQAAHAGVIAERDHYRTAWERAEAAINDMRRERDEARGAIDYAMSERHATEAALAQTRGALARADGEIERLAEWLAELGHPRQDYTIDLLEEARALARGER